MAKNTKPASAPARSRTLKLKKETIKDLSTKRPGEVKGGTTQCAVAYSKIASGSVLMSGSRNSSIAYSG